ncbi:MAG: 1-acyl-sn-glycerol-3-phosphate acyltransferase [Gemmatimonadota bacterium]
MTRPIPETYRRLRWCLARVVGVFFRRVEVVGLENIPADRGGLLVAAHPNGLIDPALMLSCFPYHVVFGARHTLFRYPILGRFARALGTVPIHRRMDKSRLSVAEQRDRNDESLAALAGAIAQGSFAALFPEGVSHDQPYLVEVKTGAARLYYRARASTTQQQSTPVIIPVGLHYDHKRLFRSAVLVVFHPSIVLEPDLDVTPAPSADPEVVRELARTLTDRIERELKVVILETESWQLHRILHRGRKLVRAERASRAGANPGGPSMDERVTGFTRMWVAYNERMRTRPAEVAALKKRIERYDRDLRGLRIKDHELDQPPPLKPLFWVILMVQLVSVVLLLPPLLLIGAIVNLPTAALVGLLARLFGREDKDAASLKLIGGVILFPATWALWAWLATTETVRTHPWFSRLPDSRVFAPLLMVVLSIFGAVLLLVYSRLALGTWRAIRVRFTRGRRARSLLRLKLERARLCDELIELASGIELPGTVAADGRVSRVRT